MATVPKRQRPRQESIELKSSASKSAKVAGGDEVPGPTGNAFDKSKGSTRRSPRTEDGHFRLHFPRHQRPEIIIGLVGAVGVDLKLAERVLSDILLTYLKYDVHPIKVSAMIRWLPGTVWARARERIADEEGERAGWWRHPAWRKDGPPSKSAPEHVRLRALMAAGTSARELTKHDDILVQLATARLVEKRAEPNPTGAPRAYIFRSLKHPSEVRFLRDLYGPTFILIGVHSDESVTLEHLRQRIAGRGLDETTRDSVCRDLIRRDHFEAEHGQRVRDTFHLSDYFIELKSGTSQDDAAKELRRFLYLLFGDATKTPRRAEFAMYLAHAAAACSGCISRQVGAVITDKHGEVLSIGWNDAPRPGLGGLITTDDDGTRWASLRPIHNPGKEDPNRKARRELIADIWDQLSTATKSKKRFMTRAKFEAAIEKSKLMDLTEFQIEVHAEVAALLAAARRGVSIAGGFLYTTTYPCHNCAKHILAAGIRRVVYREPYPKSRAMEFYSKGFSDDAASDEADRGIETRPFVGIGPTRFNDLFSIEGGLAKDVRRKGDRVAKWQPRMACFRWRPWNMSCKANEKFFARQLAVLFKKGFITWPGGSHEQKGADV